MKKLILGLILSFVAPSAFAAKLIAEVHTSGGFVPRSSGVRVYSDGTVQGFSSVNQQAPEYRALASLSPEALATLVRNIDQLTDSPLVLENPDARPCMDVPSTVIRVIQSQGQPSAKTLILYKNANCIVSQTHEGISLVKLLDGLDVLGRLY